MTIDERNITQKNTESNKLMKNFAEVCTYFSET